MMDEQNHDSETKRKRRQKYKQEPLAYAFRGSTSASRKKNQQPNLGNEYRLVQRHPAPRPQNHQQFQYNAANNKATVGNRQPYLHS